jgi:hypothetical protein
MKNTVLWQKLTTEHQDILLAVYKNAQKQLDYSHRFKFFTLHGTSHINSLFKIADILFKGGLELNEESCYLLALSICLHDVGMIALLRDKDISDILGVSQAVDPVVVEDKIRDIHHLLVDRYLNDNFNFYVSIGMGVDDLMNVSEICSLHRKKNLSSHRHAPLGALLRFIDELDISAERAPMNIFQHSYKEMDGTSCWHWYKHNITESW